MLVLCLSTTFPLCFSDSERGRHFPNTPPSLPTTTHHPTMGGWDFLRAGTLTLLPCPFTAWAWSLTFLLVLVVCFHLSLTPLFFLGHDSVEPVYSSPARTLPCLLLSPYKFIPLTTQCPNLLASMHACTVCVPTAPTFYLPHAKPLPYFYPPCAHVHLWRQEGRKKEGDRKKKNKLACAAVLADSSSSFQALFSWQKQNSLV